ncbi:MAG: hypothetical protein WCI48_04120 [Bacteroidota bacterium]
MNNTRYVEWILNSIPPGIHKEKFISSFTIEYLHETKLGDEVDVFGQGLIPEDPGRADVQAPLSTLVKGVMREDDQVVFRARLTWKDR